MKSQSKEIFQYFQKTTFWCFKDWFCFCILLDKRTFIKIMQQYLPLEEGTESSAFPWAAKEVCKRTNSYTINDHGRFQITCTCTLHKYIIVVEYLHLKNQGLELHCKIKKLS